MIISLRQAFQGLTPNGCFRFLEMLNFKENQCSKVGLNISGFKKKLRILVALWTIILLERQMKTIAAVAIGL
jgi:hypothetical protein